MNSSNHLLNDTSNLTDWNTSMPEVNINDIIGPTRTLEDIIPVESSGDNMYVLSERQLKDFESKIWLDIMPNDGMVILIEQDINSGNSMVKIVPQSWADKVMETKGSYDLHRYYSKQYPKGFTVGALSDMEEM